MKTKMAWLAIGIVVIIIVGIWIFRSRNAIDDVSIACTEEARMCPDGSAVVRSGPHCEFAPCSVVQSNVLTQDEAKKIAEQTCVKGGEVLGVGTYNENSHTWWFDANLNAVREGCNPACVVSEDTGTAEINWRCTGFTPSK